MTIDTDFFRHLPAPVQRAWRMLHDAMPDLDVALVPLPGGRFLLPSHLLGESTGLPFIETLVLSSIRGIPALPELVTDITTYGDEYAQDAIRLVNSDLLNALTDAMNPEDKTWHLDMCRARTAWSQFFRGPEAIPWRDGLRVGQIDTGYTLHRAFLSTTAKDLLCTADARTIMDASKSPTVGALTPDLNPVTSPLGTHGTASGSVISGLDLGSGFMGAAPAVPLVPVRISDDVFLDGRAEQFLAAVRYLVEEAQVPIINVSMATALPLPVAPAAMSQAVDLAYEHGVIMVCAAGNLPAPEWPSLPARLPRTIAVSGVTREKRRWSLSTTGDWVDLSAPAKDICRAVTKPDGSSWYAITAGGTTFATAMTSGAAALWLQVHWAEIQARYTGWQRVEAFRTLVTRSAQRPAGWDPGEGLGAGILDIHALLQATQWPAAADLERR